VVRIVTADIELPPNAELTRFARVVGRILSVNAPRLGDLRSTRPQAGAGFLFLEHREYQPGDDIRRINWPLSARWGKPLLRTFQAERRTDWMILVDASSSMGVGQGARWRYAVRLAAASSYALLELGHRVGIGVYTDAVRQLCPPGRGSRQFLRICALLSAARPPPHGSTAVLGSCIPQLAGVSAALVISDFLADERDGVARALRRIAAHCSDPHAIQVQNRAEVGLSRGSDFELIDAETGARASWHADETAEQRILANAAEHRQWLSGTCAAAGIRFSAIDVSAAWQSALLRHFANAARH
jgi:uncharacterized protein (DUF58 family)